uniref:Uncharacterized protein n=1 Tax=Molossus molossus TaxID=27622 RepID=A0A7J8E245_MOLMO|nr:hypothetical protein HJG59_008959 [Molossus molossus]
MSNVTECTLSPGAGSLVPKSRWLVDLLTVRHTWSCLGLTSNSRIGRRIFLKGEAEGAPLKHLPYPARGLSPGSRGRDGSVCGVSSANAPPPSCCCPPPPRALGCTASRCVHTQTPPVPCTLSVAGPLSPPYGFIQRGSSILSVRTHMKSLAVNLIVLP